MKSSLEICDIASGEVTPVLVTDRHIEAPNWTPDGAALIVNGDGALFRVPLDAPDLIPIPVEGLARLNNDHGISPDGTMLVVSDSPARGTSLIYTLPLTGGTPARITALAPSWWHGWSPDGATLAYTCMRDGHFGIATCPVDGGEETVLVTSAHHYDGPDYSADGAWIWFNSDRGGVMDLWRMRTDGSDLEQMTDDSPVNWFPHPSPDGQHVVFLAYAAGTKGHPPDHPVDLRLLNLETGGIRTLVSLFGGQGTLNVPCWAPDGQRFAYMRYAQGQN